MNLRLKPSPVRWSNLYSVRLPLNLRLKPSHVRWINLYSVRLPLNLKRWLLPVRRTAEQRAKSLPL